jgi:hypothetical protein
VLKLLEQHDGSFSIFGPDEDPLRTLPASTHSSGFRCTAGGELLWQPARMQISTNIGM